MSFLIDESQQFRAHLDTFRFLDREALAQILDFFLCRVQFYLTSAHFHVFRRGRAAETKA